MSAARSFWEQDSFYARANVAIVGAGLLGLWTAYVLKTRQPRLRITLLDAAGTPLGASTRNAGFACFGSPSELLHDAALNEAAMWATLAMRYEGIEKTRRLLGHCIDYDACGGYECYNTAAEPAPSRQQLDWLNAGLQRITGLPQTFVLCAAKLEAFGLRHFTQMAGNPLEAGLHPGKLVQALQQLLAGMGVQQLYATPIHHSQLGPRGWQLYSGQQPVLVAERLLYATNGFLAGQFPQLGLQPARGQVLLTPPLPGLSLRGTFHFKEGYYYWRHLQGRVLLGGARHLFVQQETATEAQTTAPVLAALLQFLHKHLPQAAGVQLHECTSWAGIMAQSGQKQPLLQALGSECWAAMCCNGMGVALAPVWAEKVADALLG
jgi:gamma-glutamylputrescine oxidase